MTDQPWTLAIGFRDEEDETAELWRRKRAALEEHIAAMTDEQARTLLADVAEALDSLRGAYVGDPRDWGQYKRDAWTYGIVCGWGEDLAEDGLPLVEHIGRQHGWTDANIARLRRYEAAVEHATGHGRDLWPELRGKP